MSAYIYDIATAVPAISQRQDDIREIMKERVPTNRKSRTIIHQIYAHSGIEKRHLDNAQDYHTDESSFFHRIFDRDNPPGTEERNDIYRTEATRLFVEVAEKLLAQNPQISKEAVTHVVTVSCTGFFAPGPEFEVVKQLGLPPSTERYHIGFMGCYAMFPALRLAQTICKADPDAVVMAISCELSGLHLQASEVLDDLVAASVFADGASGALITSTPPEKSGFELLNFTNALAYEGEKEMVWTIGNKGFNLALSRYIPDIIEGNLSEIIEPILREHGISKNEIAMWAVHPGGRIILDKIEQSMSLKPEQIAPSRTVLANYGNMSSATILFVLDEVRKAGLSHGAHVLPMAFGPGLTIETGLFRYLES